MSDDLDKLPDAALNELFAVEVAGWSVFTFPGGALPNAKHFKDALGRTQSIYMQGNFCADANAVLPWLEGYSAYKVEFIKPSIGYQHRVDIFTPLDARGPIGYAHSPTFARAAVIALLRAARAQKESKT